MQSLSTSQKEHLYEGGFVGVTITAESMDGGPFLIGQDDIIQDTFKIERNWVHGSNIEIGCADASELTFALDNYDGRWDDITWEGARLTVVLDIDEEPLQAGIFTVDEPPRKLTTIQIRALDDMVRFNRLYDTNLSYPASLLEILLDACSKCNVTLNTVDFVNKEYVVDQRPEGDDITYHHIVAWVAELAGCNAWIDHLSRLNISWYGQQQSGDLEIGPDERFSFELADAPIEITGVVLRTSDGNDYLVGTDEYALIIEENPLLQGDDMATPLTNILSAIGGTEYWPYTFDILAYPHLWPGDVITKLVTPDDRELQSIITNHTYRLNHNSRIAAKGKTKTVAGYATGAPFTPRQKRVLQAAARIEAARQTSAMEQAVLRLNELMVNSLGFYTTTVELETGAKIVYTHDKPVLEESQVIWTMTEQGFSWTDEGWNGGDPVWKYGVTSDGSIITKLIQTVGLLADWIIVESGGSNLTTVLQSMDGRIELRVKNDNIISSINLTPEEARIEASRLTIGAGTNFQSGIKYTWEQYFEQKWWQIADIGILDDARIIQDIERGVIYRWSMKLSNGLPSLFLDEWSEEEQGDPTDMLKDDVTDKYYAWNFTLSDGVLGIELTEVTSEEQSGMQGDYTLLDNVTSKTYEWEFELANGTPRIKLMEVD